jgi:spore coat polysaccharide biosynthesis protein SpsF (cytidylyltransferase family)
MERVVGIVQARMASTRLPGKTLADIGGAPMLKRTLDRLARAGLDEVVAATTDRPEDARVAEAVAAWGYPCFCGDSEDVLGRHYAAARAHRADVIVRVTSDCPFADPGVIRETVEELRRTGADYSSNARPVSSYPEGLDVEAFRFEALERAERESRWWSEREHVTPHLWKNPQRFRIANLTAPVRFPRIRLTIDEPADLEFARAVVALAPALDCGWRELCGWIAANLEQLPDNRSVQRDAGYLRSIASDRLWRVEAAP